MILKKLISRTIILCIFFSFQNYAHAAGTVVEPTGTTTAQPISGKNPDGESQAISVDAAGLIGINSGAAYTQITNGVAIIAAAGATSRQQLPDLDTHSCTLQAKISNAGSAYVGGSTVTNGSGINPGVELIPGAAINNVGTSNAQLIYIAGDNVLDEVSYVCN